MKPENGQTVITNEGEQTIIAMRGSAIKLSNDQWLHVEQLAPAPENVSAQWVWKGQKMNTKEIKASASMAISYAKAADESMKSACLKLREIVDAVTEQELTYAEMDPIIRDLQRIAEMTGNHAMMTRLSELHNLAVFAEMKTDENHKKKG